MLYRKIEKEIENHLKTNTNEVLTLSENAFVNSDTQIALKVEPLEQVIDGLKEKMRTRHIIRMQSGKCSVEVGFIWSDLLTNAERVSDHCSNIAGCVIDNAERTLNVHETLNEFKNNSSRFAEEYKKF